MGVKVGQEHPFYILHTPSKSDVGTPNSKDVKKFIMAVLGEGRTYNFLVVDDPRVIAV